MEILWVSEGAVPAPDIAAQLPSHAYTTIMTILHRLGKKGYVTRVRVGRSYSYAASESLASFSAKTMHDTLELAHDRAAVLAAFVALGTHEDRAQLSLALEHASQQQQPEAKKRRVGLVVDVVMDADVIWLPQVNAPENPRRVRHDGDVIWKCFRVNVL